ncbi:MAG: hypothetical protein K0Q59_2730 [Paenibacillus sp.]|nr:hypothetical protein [Paenibacillus sp.]
MLPGGIHADGAEISETRFLPIEEALRDLLVIDLTKEMILAYLSHKNGLFHLHKSISTNNSWAKYEVFV